MSQSQEGKVHRRRKGLQQNQRNSTRGSRQARYSTSNRNEFDVEETNQVCIFIVQQIIGWRYAWEDDEMSSVVIAGYIRTIHPTSVPSVALLYLTLCAFPRLVFPLSLKFIVPRYSSLEVLW